MQLLYVISSYPQVHLDHLFSSGLGTLQFLYVIMVLAE